MSREKCPNCRKKLQNKTFFYHYCDYNCWIECIRLNHIDNGVIEYIIKQELAIIRKD